MDKTLIIGGAANYGWNELKNWVNSIKATGYKGDIALVVTNVTKETLDKLTEEGVTTFAYGKPNDSGGYEAQSGGPPHVERFFYIWNSIRNLDYDLLVVTDTRDVIFQRNPVEFLKHDDASLFCSSEGLLYKDEPWGNKNFLEAFGPFFHDIYKEKMIYNVGTIAGSFSVVRDVLLSIFQMSINRPIPIVDQAVFNFLIHQEPLTYHTEKLTNGTPWAIQLGTTIHAVESGAGDIGMTVRNDPTQLIKYQMLYKDDQPIIDDDGYVMNKEGDKFFIVHQYDRVAGLKEKIDRRYA